MFNLSAQGKIRIDKMTRRLLIGQLMIDTRQAMQLIASFVDGYCTTTYRPDAATIEDYLKYDPQQLDSILDTLGDSITMLTEFSTSGTVKITRDRLKPIIYGAMKVQQIFDEYVIRDNPRTCKIWVVTMDDGIEAIVSAYSWDIALRKFPQLTDKEHTSLVKYDMDVDTMTLIDKLIRDTPWALLIPHEGKNVYDTVPNVPLYVPEQWGTPTITIAEKLLKEEDLRILAHYAK